MGSGGSKGKNKPVKRWSREEILEALEVHISKNEKGKEIVKSGLLDLINGPKATAGKEFSWTSVCDPEDPDRDASADKALDKLPFDDPREDRCFGAMFGLAVGDAMGARVEFTPLNYESDDIKGMGEGRGGKFLLLPGQWTDDTSLALCVADSLLAKGHFDGHDMMHRFLAWWYCGLNNSGRFEEDEKYHTSFGLGSVVKYSLREYLEHPVVATEAGNKYSCGNGSLMRLAPVPIYFRSDMDQALTVAEQQSYVTHQGTEAAECCRLMAHIMVRGLAGEDLHTVLDSLATSFKTDCPGVSALAQSMQEILVPEDEEGKEADTAADSADTAAEPQMDPDRNWNWKADDFKYSPARTKQNPGYIGGYAMDALAMALHILWKTSTLPEAVLKAVNLRGDADTLAAIVGQIAGSFYGCSTIPTEWKRTVMQWDNKEIALRARHLYEHSEEKKQQ